MRILVTGGAGFIGSHLVDRLLEDGHEVRVLDILDPQVHQGKPDHLNPRAEYIFDDVRNEDAMKGAIEGVDVISHQAAAVGIGQSMYQIKKYVDANTYGTAKLLDLLANSEHEVKRLIVASSMSIYGEGSYSCENCGEVYPSLRDESQMRSNQWEMYCPGCGKEARPVPTTEEKPLSPMSIYAITKRDQEEMCLNVGRAYGIPTVALRYFNVYGPRQSMSNPYTGVCAIFSSRIKNGNKPIIFEDGKQTRDFINIADIVQANMLAIDNPNMDYGFFNVGTGKPTSVLDIANTLMKLYGKEGLGSSVENRYRTGDIRHCFSDISKIRGMGFSPSVDLEEGLKQLVGWGSKVDAEDRSESATRELERKSLVQ